MSNDPPPYAEDFWAADLFHPSASGYRDWAEWAVDEAWGRGLGMRSLTGAVVRMRTSTMGR